MLSSSAATSFTYSAGIENVADFAMEHVGDGIRVGNGGDCAVLRIRIEKKPRIVRFRNGLSEGKPIEFQKITASAEHTGRARLIEVQATRILAGAQAERVELRVFHGAKIQIVATRGRVQIPKDRQLRFGGERKSSRAGMGSDAATGGLRNASSATTRKTAEEISAITSTLRPGRWLALRTPSFTTLETFPICPRSLAHSKKIAPVSRSVPAPKNAPASGIACANAEPTKASAEMVARAATIRSQRVPCFGFSSMARFPESKSRGELRFKLRNVASTQSSAINTPAIAPLISESEDTCKTINPVPTAPRHHVFNP